ncbi:MAG: radical SAM protein [Deltaproteobacteria bacterium]|jgi:putative pyruvate formate lyase activating enzyme|nr:radical SAM protein [Deltaproteobacteria bacterium]MBW2535580.1 radical SAM protein [Deltaproteobacteria bacterium]
MVPCYLLTHERGELRERARRAREGLADCQACPRVCRVDRLAGQLGICEVGSEATVASAGPHFGEESPLVGRGGSGTIFLSSCNLRCVFCQNYDISQDDRGRRVSAATLGRMMLELQGLGCHNINFVTPSHQVAAILAGLCEAIEGGLTVPLVYNTSGYDSVETLQLLDGVVDIYMPDLKTLDPECARRYLRAEDYPGVVRAALKEMFRQVGDLETDEEGIAVRGILLRHLVMPGGLASTEQALTFVRDELSPNTYVNIMAQWRPAGETAAHPAIDRPLQRGEYAEALAIAERVGVHRLDQRRPKFLWPFP